EERHAPGPPRGGVRLAPVPPPRPPSGRLARPRPPPASPVTDAELRLIGVVGVAGTVLLRHLGVVARARVLIRDDEPDRSAERASLEHAAQDANGVGLLPLRDQSALAGRAPVEAGLDGGFRDPRERVSAV